MGRESMTLTDVLTELGIPYTEAGESRYVRDGWVGLVCPQCRGGNALGIHLSSKAVSCWKCGRGQRLINVLADISGQSQAVIWPLLDKVGLSPSKDARTPSRGILTLPKGILEGPLHPAHQKYLRGRGFNPDHLHREWGVRSIGVAAELSWSLLFPITLNGKVMSWTTRSISEKGGRYVTARPDQEAMPARRLLFGMDKVRHTIVVVEGPLDAIAVGPGAVATMGIAYTAAQAALIARFPRRIICFDAEPDAQRQAARLARELAPFDGVTYQVEFTTAKDASRADRAEVQELRDYFLEG
jgi:hypothetical protein